MFTVHSARGRDDVDFPVPAQFRLIGTARVGEDLIGERGGDLDYAYNPFELYGAAKTARDQALPPHLVFAALDSPASEDACAFLDAYGPLEGTNEYEVLAGDTLKEWREMSRGNVSPETHLRAILGQVPLLPPPPTPQGLFHRYGLKQFWHAQGQFERTLRLSSALISPTNQLESVQRAVASIGEEWDIRGPNVQRSYVMRAQEIVSKTMNSKLRFMKPRVMRVMGKGTIEGAWPCYSLLEAMYLMLFLDIASRGARIAQCEKCARLFYTGRENAKYCSPICENRARSLRAYHRRRR